MQGGKNCMDFAERDHCNRFFWDHRVHRVATAAFWRTFSDEGKIGPGW